MAQLCFHCDGELIDGAKFCHRCGTPNFSGRQEQGGSAEERARVKEDVVGAARVPTVTRMVSTVLLPQAPRAKGPPPGPPLWKKVLQARVWRRPYVWLALAAVGLVTGAFALIEDIQDKSKQQGELHRIATRLTSICVKDSRAQIEGYVAQIQKSAGGPGTLLDSAVVFEYMLRRVPSPQGDCSKVVEALVTPGRLEALMRE
jgi:hypothetical protein